LKRTRTGRFLCFIGCHDDYEFAIAHEFDTRTTVRKLSCRRCGRGAIKRRRRR
jgi:hypothetical protein